MLSKIALVASALAASVSAQGVTAKISPTAPAPAGCTGTNAQPFNIAVVNATSASQKMKRQSQYNNADVLAITLTNGVLTDSKGRIGYIAANRQFQFDGPPQTGAVYTSGFSVCGNGTLALGGSTIWYECLSGAPSGSNAGSFYNLYDQSQGPQCFQIFIDALPVTSSSSSSAVSTSAVTQITDGQIQATTPASSLASTTTRVSQISDGQIQATTPASSLASSTTVSRVSQISDGQIQATTPASSLRTTSTSVASSVSRVSQISDGQIQATTPANGTVVRPTTVAPYLGNGAAVMTAAPAAAALGLAALFML